MTLDTEKGWKHLGCGTVFQERGGPPVPCPVCGDKPTLKKGWRPVEIKRPIPREKRAGPAPGSLKKKILKRDGGRCVKCGSRDRLTVDHIVPRARGGTNDPANLQTLCHTCNQEKGSSIQAGES